MLVLSAPLHAGDRKSAAEWGDSGLFAERFVARHVVSLPAHPRFAFAPVSAFDGRAEHFVEGHATSAADQRERATGPIDRKITLFRFNTKRFGEVGVHPLLGGVKGLQVSVGF